MNNIDHNILAYNAAMFAAIFGAPAPRPQPASPSSFSGLTRESTQPKGQTDEQD